MGYSAEKVLRDIAESDGAANMTWRQIAVVDKDGRTAAHTGASNEDWKGHVTGPGYVALGNRLTSERTAQAMSEAYERSEGEELAERLVLLTRGGARCGRSGRGRAFAALLVVNRKSYAWVDLRADEHDEPIGELRRLYGLYIPLIPYYDARPSNPSMPRA